MDWFSLNGRLGWPPGWLHRRRDGRRQHAPGSSPSPKPLAGRHAVGLGQRFVFVCSKAQARPLGLVGLSAAGAYAVDRRRQRRCDAGLCSASAHYGRLTRPGALYWTPTQQAGAL